MTSYCRNTKVQDHLVKQKRRWNVNYLNKETKNQSLLFKLVNGTSFESTFL